MIQNQLVLGQIFKHDSKSIFSMILNDALAFQNSVFHGKVLVGAPFMKQQYKPTIANLVFHWKVLVGMPLLK